MAETLISPGVLARENDISFIAPAPVEAGAAFIGPAVKGPVEDPVVVTSYGQYQRLFGTTFESGSNKYEFLTSLAIKSYFNQGGNSAIVARVVSGSFTRAASTHVTASGVSTKPFALETLGKGIIYNGALSADPADISLNSDGSLSSGSKDNLRWEISNVDNSKGTFSLVVRRGDDNTKNKIILETFNDLSLDPNDGNYIERVVGNQYRSKTTDGDGSIYVKTFGEYVNKSNYIRVSAVNTPTLNYLGTDGITVNTDSSDVSFSGSLPTAGQSGSFYSATGKNFPDNRKANFHEDISNSDTQGLTAANYADSISILENKDEYVFNIVSAPGLIYDFGNHKTQIDSIVSLAENRGDCIAVVDLEQYGATVSNVTAAAATINTSYGAAYWPWLQTQSSTGKNVWIPASTIIPGVYAFTDGAAAPWFAPAGLTRGGISDVIQAERKLTRTQRDTLYKSNVNPIATFPGAGINVFGQKTLQKKSSALDRVNVRRLLIALKKFIGDVSRNLVFEQNTTATRNNFLAQVNPYLESVVQRQGLFAFRVQMDETNNTADTIDRNQLIGQVFIQPAKTVEFIVLDFTIEPTGASFGG
jgi:phage tail sheath protein FI|tara:strand:- start:264 stop:2027 length:1764 start_codon:yes stop_codon:yes gene_type:complete